MADNRIDPTPARISTNFTVPKQTQTSTFGERLSGGLQQGANALAQGAALVGGVIPGGAIISAAVSSVTNLATGGATSSTAAYSAAGVMGSTVGGGLSTTLGMGAPTMTATGSAGPNLNAGASTNNVGMMNNELVAASSENAKLLQVQIALQRENQVFTSVSNVLKTKHDTVKNSISNIR